MSKAAGSRLDSVRVDDGSGFTGRHKSDFMFVNSAFVGSLSQQHLLHHDNFHMATLNYEVTHESVIREQYWACSKWPLGQRVLAIAVGVLLGAVISLSIIVAIRGDDRNIANIIKSRPAPD
ncbi:unnamed protein product [Leptidea sinapis]|uniref:Uncharacterized protein n=1 Tax=Leptidea sinapis TaxID=189913 RepID=A0A5E4R7M6_9NEOP|nr:unnamed protein product [Leptidea sinapis]